MKKGMLLLVMLIVSNGCDEEVMESFDYVVVTVTGTAHVAEYDFDNSEWLNAVEGEAVEMALIKAGGQRIEDIGTTGGGVGQTTIHGSFNLYKEQPIEFTAKLVSDPMVFGSDKVEWSYVDENKTYGGKNQPDICDVNLYVALKVPK